MFDPTKSCETRIGQRALVIHTKGPDPEFPIAAWVWGKNDGHFLFSFTAEGQRRMGGDSDDDLVNILDITENDEIAEKNDLAKKINDIIRNQGLTVVAAADRFGMTTSRMMDVHLRDVAEFTAGDLRKAIAKFDGIYIPEEPEGVTVPGDGLAARVTALEAQLAGSARMAADVAASTQRCDGFLSIMADFRGRLEALESRRVHVEIGGDVVDITARNMAANAEDETMRIETAFRAEFEAQGKRASVLIDRMDDMDEALAFLGGDNG